jgi:hypothetical protein
MGTKRKLCYVFSDPSVEAKQLTVFIDHTAQAEEMYEFIKSTKIQI